MEGRIPGVVPSGQPIRAGLGLNSVWACEQDGKCLHETELELRNYKGKFSFSVVRPEHPVAFGHAAHMVLPNVMSAQFVRNWGQWRLGDARSPAELGKKVFLIQVPAGGSKPRKSGARH